MGRVWILGNLQQETLFRIFAFTPHVNPSIFHNKPNIAKNYILSDHNESVKEKRRGHTMKKMQGWKKKKRFMKTVRRLIRLWKAHLLRARIWLVLSGENKLLFLKKGVLFFFLLWGSWIALMRSSCIIVVACYLVCVSVFIAAEFLLLKVRFKAVAQCKNSKAKFQCLRCNLFIVFFSVWPGGFILLLYTTTTHIDHGDNMSRKLNYCHTYTEWTVIKTLTTALWTTEIWRCFARSPVQPPTFSTLLGSAFIRIVVARVQECTNIAPAAAWTKPL